MAARSIVRALGVIAVLFAAQSASAQQARETPQQVKGRALFNEGVALFNGGNFAAACPKLEASLQAYAGIGTRGKLAECYEKLGRFASAWSLYLDVARLSRESHEPQREQVATERARALESKLSRVTIVIAQEAPGLIVRRNGRAIDRDGLRDQVVDAGTVRVEVEAPGRKTFATERNVAPGASLRVDVPALETVGGQSTSYDDPSYPSERPSDRSWQRPLGLALAGTGVAALAVGSVFGLSAKSSYDDAFDSGACDRTSRMCNGPGQDAVDDAHKKATISTILFISGGVLATGGAVLFFTAPRSSSGSARLTVSPSVDPFARGASLAAGGVF